MDRLSPEEIVEIARGIFQMSLEAHLAGLSPDSLPTLPVSGSVKIPPCLTDPINLWIIDILDSTLEYLKTEAGLQRITEPYLSERTRTALNALIRELIQRESSRYPLMGVSLLRVLELSSRIFTYGDPVFHKISLLKRSRFLRFFEDPDEGPSWALTKFQTRVTANIGHLRSIEELWSINELLASGILSLRTPPVIEPDESPFAEHMRRFLSAFIDSVDPQYTAYHFKTDGKRRISMNTPEGLNLLTSVPEPHDLLFVQADPQTPLFSLAG